MDLQQAELAPEEILRRLEVCATGGGDSKVLDDVYDLAQKQLQSEEVHAGKLDARASSLFGAVGFSMTVAFSFGGWSLLENARKVPFGSTIAIAFVIALFIGLATSLFALQGLLLRYGHKSIDEKEVFHPDVLAPRRTQADFRIHIAVHFWRIWQSRSRRNEKRAVIIQRGQRLFFAFLLSILGLSTLTTWSAITRSPGTSHAPNSCNIVGSIADAGMSSAQGN
jgi:hypothetical protein